MPVSGSATAATNAKVNLVFIRYLEAYPAGRTRPHLHWQGLNAAWQIFPSFSFHDAAVTTLADYFTFPCSSPHLKSGTASGRRFRTHSKFCLPIGRVSVLTPGTTLRVDEQQYEWGKIAH